MRRLILIGILLTVVFGLMASTVLAMSRQQPAPAALTLLRLTDCQSPCWVGIEPGKTTITAAKQRLIQVFGSADSGFNIDFGDNINPHVLWVNLQRRSHPDGMIQVVMDAHFGSVVQSITFSFESLFLTDQPLISDAFRVFGTPSKIALPEVILNRLSVAFDFGTEARGVAVFAVPFNFPPWAQPIRTMVFYANGQEPLPPSTRVHPWQGFQLNYGSPRVPIR